MTGHRGAKR